jgi:Protein of unknown function (DUF732)
MWSILLRAVIAGAAMSVAFAAPAAADEGGYLYALQDRYTSLSAQQLLAEGRTVCNAISSGMNSTSAVVMVQKHLGVSVPAAGDIVSAAVVHLGC